MKKKHPGLLNCPNKKSSGGSREKKGGGGPRPFKTRCPHEKLGWVRRGGRVETGVEEKNIEKKKQTNNDWRKE